ncbi:MAG: DUF4160 domain-containing protein [Lachnospiraceae bacterium]|nr:DUF4160 domain-containing protein [Lachnospiraceae bacterium]
MPVISRFHGITIKMYLRQKEHNPPHVHAIYGNDIGLFDIRTGEMFEGDLPPKQRQMIAAFIQQNSTRLIEMWETQKYELIPWAA